MREELTKVETPLSLSSTICALITGDGYLCLSISRDEDIQTGNQVLQRKGKLLLTEDKIRSFTHLVYHIELFLQWMTLTDVEAPVGEEIEKNDPSLPEEI